MSGHNQSCKIKARCEFLEIPFENMSSGDRKKAIRKKIETQWPIFYRRLDRDQQNRYKDLVIKHLDEKAKLDKMARAERKAERSKIRVLSVAERKEQAKQKRIRELERKVKVYTELLAEAKKAA